MAKTKAQLKSNLREMSIADVSAWLETLSLSKHSDSFVKNGIDGHALMQIDKASLAELGLSALEQTRVMAALDRHNTAAATNVEAKTATQDARSASPVDEAKPKTSRSRNEKASRVASPSLQRRRTLLNRRRQRRKRLTARK